MTRCSCRNTTLECHEAADCKVLSRIKGSSSVETDLYKARKRVGELLKERSGKDFHDSDCATNNAPAYMPLPCDCQQPLTVRM